jgi:hypothetical protein
MTKLKGHQIRRGCTHPCPPILGGAPVSPSAMARAVVLKAALLLGAKLSGRAAAFAIAVRSIFSKVGEKNLTMGSLDAIDECSMDRGPRLRRCVD